MNPEADSILRLSAEDLMTKLAPLLPQYQQGTTALIGSMLALAANEYERGADIRATENNEIRALFSELASVATDTDLRAKLKAAARGRDASLRISALNQANYELRRLLTLLHAHIEAIDGAAARTAERRIWTLLKAMATRRMVSLTPSP